MDFTVDRTDGYAKRGVVPILLDEARARGLRDRRVTLHVVPHRHSAIDDRTTRHAGYRLNPRSRILAGRSSTEPSRHAGRGGEAKGGAGVPAGQRSASRRRGNARRQQTNPAHRGMAEIGVRTNPGSPSRPWSMNRVGSFSGHTAGWTIRIHQHRSKSHLCGATRRHGRMLGVGQLRSGGSAQNTVCDDRCR